MKIVVLVKEVPDTYGERVLNSETGLADRGASETVIDEIGERAMEVALAHKDAHPDTELTVLTMGPESVSGSIRKTLALGADSAIHVADNDLIGADLGLTAEVLAAAAKRNGFDLIIGGNLSTDGSGGMIPAMVAEILDIPSALNLNSVTITADAISGEQTVDAGTAEVTAALPAIVSITERLPDVRLANFKGIMAAKKKPYETVTLADLGIDAHSIEASRSIMLSVAKKPAREAGTTITDEGDAGDKLADFLIENRLV